ncbi:hypothetical protein [Catalinimonas niigatensis]|uniref:hypothetical protein n=1 Tax=Catalinimonas niigatensis TaxID=1397264 RepID=UPI002666E2D5|nr:hypothetical protein [Catalinimonas niigatensis]WPP53009.1 hypothetical protein PZB72_11545 [Catalinimonas niigatensis]
MLYLMVLLYLPDASVYASSTQKQASDFFRTESVFSQPWLADKAITYQKALAEYRERKRLLPDLCAATIHLSLQHNRLFKVTFTRISNSCFDCLALPGFEQVKTIPQSSAELPLSPFVV